MRISLQMAHSMRLFKLLSVNSLTKCLMISLAMRANLDSNFVKISLLFLMMSTSSVSSWKYVNTNYKYVHEYLIIYGIKDYHYQFINYINRSLECISWRIIRAGHLDSLLVIFSLRKKEMA